MRKSFRKSHPPSCCGRKERGCQTIELLLINFRKLWPLTLCIPAGPDTCAVPLLHLGNWEAAVPCPEAPAKCPIPRLQAFLCYKQSPSVGSQSTSKSASKIWQISPPTATSLLLWNVSSLSHIMGFSGSGRKGWTLHTQCHFWPVETRLDPIPGPPQIANAIGGCTQRV